MPMPQQYQIAQQAFDALIEDARDALGLATRHQTYTVIEAVLVTFRRRLGPDDVLIFADGLPALLRAIFTANWSPDEHRPQFASIAALEDEVAGLRRHHNFAPRGSIAAVAGAVRRHVDAERFDSALARLSPEAREFWRQ